MTVVGSAVGDGELVVSAAEDPHAVLLLGHGAGGQIDAFDLSELARALPGRGITVARFVQPWKVAGKRISAPAGQLDTAFEAAMHTVRARWPGLPLFTGGRSQGSRVACRTSDRGEVAGVVCLAFPLHPPGRPERSRLPELQTPDQPVLVCQGSRDTFGSAQLVTEVTRGRANVRVVEIEGADHSMRTRKRDGRTPDQVGEQIIAEVAGFIG